MNTYLEDVAIFIGAVIVAIFLISGVVSCEQQRDEDIMASRPLSFITEDNHQCWIIGRYQIICRNTNE